MKRLLRRLVLNPLLVKLLSRISTHPGIRRRIVSCKYLYGQGLEIGALHNPLPVCPSVKVRYVDQREPGVLESHYWWLKSSAFTRVDVIDDGERLASVADGSEDFIIANHVLEHLENPLLALESWLRVIRNEGVIFLSVPNKNETFDLKRPVTTFDHVLTDLRHGPQGSRRQHYLEWVTQVGDMSGREAEDHATHLMESRISIHFHCWDPPALLELLMRCRSELDLPMDVDLFETQGNEMLVIIRKVEKGATKGAH